MTKTNVQSTPSNSQRHDTPNNKTHVIKFRVTAEEKASLELTCKLLNLSLSTFIRRSIHNVKIEKTVIVAGGEETLTAVSTLLAQCSKVGGNLNQLARHFNSGGADTEQIRAPRNTESKNTIGFNQPFYDFRFLELRMLIVDIFDRKKYFLYGLKIFS